MDTKTTTIDGTVLQSLPNTIFKVQLVTGQEVLTVLTGKIRKQFVRILPGDRVRVEMTPYDKNRGRIISKF